jgi:hypothetical protein
MSVKIYGLGFGGRKGLGLGIDFRLIKRRIETRICFFFWVIEVK